MILSLPAAGIFLLAEHPSRQTMDLRGQMHIPGGTFEILAWPNFEFIQTSYGFNKLNFVDPREDAGTMSTCRSLSRPL